MAGLCGDEEAEVPAEVSLVACGSLVKNCLKKK